MPKFGELQADLVALNSTLAVLDKEFQDAAVSDTFYFKKRRALIRDQEVALRELQKILESELTSAGRTVDHSICEHFEYTRQELFWIIKLGHIESFDELITSHGQGNGCEVCRPAVASILAATWNELVFDHATIQDTNDRFLANIQRGGTYSVILTTGGGLYRYQLHDLVEVTGFVGRCPLVRFLGKEDYMGLIII